MKLLEFVLQDWSRNPRNAKGRIVLIMFRLANLAALAPVYIKPIAYPYAILYRILIEWVLGIELPWKLTIGKGLCLFHGQGTVINDHVRIGDYCIIRHNTTIGVSRTNFDFHGAAPVIGNSVDIGAGAIIIGGITIGDHVKIAAGSVVVKNVPPCSTVAGNPAKVIRTESGLE